MEPRIWRKSRASQTNGACVQIAWPSLDAIGDSKDPHGPTLEGVDVRELIRAIKEDRIKL